MRVTGVSSLIIVNWFKFLDSLDKLKSYSPGLLAHSTLGLQASIFILPPSTCLAMCTLTFPIVSRCILFDVELCT